MIEHGHRLEDLPRYALRSQLIYWYEKCAKRKFLNGVDAMDMSVIAIASALGDKGANKARQRIRAATKLFNA